MSQNGFQLGRIFGISINIDWSWVFIFILVMWNLATGVFPSLHPQWSTSLNWITALVAALLFFASVVAHELAHSVVAKARGLPVNRIVLFLFGGVSNIEREPASPQTEFLMAIVGPLTSFVLGIIFLVLGAIGVYLSGGVAGGPLRFLGRLDPVSTLLLWLGPINLVLAIFNMVPGFPLDGGRVLRSILWAAMHNLQRATRVASWVGQGVAWIFIGIGVSMIFGIRVPFFGTGFISGLWLAFIGWFLNNAAVQSYRQSVVEGVLEGIPVQNLMRPNAVSVPPTMPLSTLVYDYFVHTDESAIPVLEHDRLVGLVSLADAGKVSRGDWHRTTVAQVMTPADKLMVATPREDASQALSDLSLRDERQIPVVQEGRLVGMLRRADILRYLQVHHELAAR
ncbi:MAG TPA: site-2 protease family protein [Anaerolineae bacterium]